MGNIRCNINESLLYFIQILYRLRHFRLENERMTLDELIFNETLKCHSHKLS